MIDKIYSAMQMIRELENSENENYIYDKTPDLLYKIGFKTSVKKYQK